MKHKVTWTVEFDYNWYGQAMAMRRGFETEEEAFAWAKENTSDGKVIQEEELW